MAEQKWKDWLDFLKEAGQTLGSMAGFASFLETVKPVAETMMNHVLPETAIRLKRAAQKGSEGAADDVQFIKTLLILDGDNPRLQHRPLLEIITSYLTWLNKKDLAFSVMFIWVVGLEMDDDERFRFLQTLALITDPKGSRSSDEAHQARFEFTQNYEAFRKPVSIFTRYFNKHPDLKENIQKLWGFREWDEKNFRSSAELAETRFAGTLDKIKERYTSKPKVTKVSLFSKLTTWLGGVRIVTKTKTATTTVWKKIWA